MMDQSQIEFYFSHFNNNPLPPCPQENVVFGSLLVQAQSNTPYTDATQVSQVGDRPIKQVNSEINQYMAGDQFI